MKSQQIDVSGIGLRAMTVGPDMVPPAIVFLHEGLGSVDLWRGFPAALVERIGAPGLTYDRQGHGRSDPSTSPRTPSYLHDAALEELVAVLAATGVESPLLVGHSDGASIALIYAAHHPVSGLVLIAPHVFVEAAALTGIRRTDQDAERLIERLSRYHDHPSDLYRAWRDIWLSSEFESWNIESDLPQIEAPMLVIQGEADEYGTLEQLDRIEAHAAVPVTRHVVVGAGHSPHSSHEAEVVDAVGEFVVDMEIEVAR